jgi:large repetitive protein
MTMKTRQSNSGTNRSVVRGVGRLALAASIGTLLLTGVLASPAGAAGPYATNTAIATAPAAPVTGQSVTFTVTVTSPTAPVFAVKPRGTILFTISSGVNCDGGNTVTLTNSKATCTVSGGLMAANSPYSVEAAYTPVAGSLYKPSQKTIMVTVTPGSTMTTVASSVNPSVSGQPLTITVHVSAVAPSVGTPTGTVKFTGDGKCSAGVPVISGVATCHIPNGLLFTGQPYHVTATYEGDGNFSGSSASFTQKVTKAHATISLAVSPNTCNGGMSCQEVPGSPLTLTATTAALPPTVGYPAGPVVFSILPAGSATSLPCQGGNSVAPTAGVATCQLPAGVPADVYYTVTATLEDPNFVQVSSTLFLSASLISSTTTLTVPTAATAGQSFWVIAHVTEVGTSSPTPPSGLVSITVCVAGVPRSCKGTDVVLHSNGYAVLAVLGGEFPGQYEAYARYLGDQNYWGSTAPNISADIFNVTQTPTVLAVSSDNNASLSGTAVNLTTTLTAINNAAASTLVGPPTGTITYTITDPNNVSYSCQSGNTFTIRIGHVQGAFTCFIPPAVMFYENNPPGTPYTVTVNYSGDSNYLPSTVTYIQTVVPPQP